jgi:hypothetical protein
MPPLQLLLDPAGVFHVPSPLQYVDALALVPPFKLPTGKLPVTPVDNGSPVALVNTKTVGVPKLGVTNEGDVLNTRLPEPVSFEITPANCAEVVEENCPRFPEVTAHVGQEIVPVVVIVPPEIGPEVATLVTLPLPPPPVPDTSTIKLPDESAFKYTNPLGPSPTTATGGI